MIYILIFMAILPLLNLVLKFIFQDSYNWYFAIFIPIATILITIIDKGINREAIQTILIITTGTILLVLFEKIFIFFRNKIIKVFIKKNLLDSEEISRIVFFKNKVYLNTKNHYYYLDLKGNSMQEENDIKNLPNYNKIKNKFK